MQIVNKRAFSLIELLIVIAIISIVGFLSFDALKISTIKNQTQGIKDLKKLYTGSRDKELICINKCAKCFIMGGAVQGAGKSKFDELEVYILDDNDNTQKVDFGRYDDKSICLRFHYYSNGSTSQMIIESKDKFYYFPAYFGEVEIFDSLGDAKDKWLEHTNLTQDRGNYY